MHTKPILRKPLILVAPLDWGLGHATRCIPVIRILKQKSCQIVIAASGKTKILLKNEFPDLEFLELEGYDIQYAKTKAGLVFKLLLQIVPLVKKIKKETRWLNETINNYQIDAVISDNRFGLHSSKIKSIFITHQLQIAAPFSFAERWIQKINYSFINKFSQCWVPDFSGENNLAGKLSHPEINPKISVKYLGPLVRFNETKHESAIHFDVCILLSGPEPQRTILEEKVFEQIKNSNQKIIVVRGLPESSDEIFINSNTTVINHASGEVLQKIIEESNFVISRSGYTTIMELMFLKKKSILIPTPGQTEQEYLSKYLSAKKYCIAFDQDKLDFNKAINDAEIFDYQFPETSSTLLEKTIDEFLQQLA